ncbi:hybrid sensor histidine kinase/response regulator [Vibrio coralliilyticus]|uniref:hybrid sensor histidine kinase/response regulator n=1 Tax=Vibrio coralliilyticus TaxID=190893 RepID=UPI0020A42053|nr:hybrid sensor histidine kinase/response regulator [Vibrio coralliilyticus]
MNNWSTLWSMFLVASIFFHVQLTNKTSVLLFQMVMAILLAYASMYFFSTDLGMRKFQWEYTLLAMLIYAFGHFIYLKYERELSMVRSLGAGVAHEMRNPLSSLKASLEKLNFLLTELVVGSNSKCRMPDQNVLKACEVVSGAIGVIYTANETIDFLLTSIDERCVSNTSFQKHSILKIIDSSLKNYGYKNVRERNSVVLIECEDFDIFGSDTLVKYIIYNLLRNSFYYENIIELEVTLQLRSLDKYNELVFKDNGLGVAAKNIRRIFDDFYTNGKIGGHGLGLSFCKKVMKAHGGDISCRSKLGEWTEFTLTFPKYMSLEAVDIRHNLIKTKSILFIGENGTLSRRLHEVSYSKGFCLNQLDLMSNIEHSEVDFKHDLVFIDLDSIMSLPKATKWLEKLLKHTEGKIAVLVDNIARRYSSVEFNRRVSTIEKHWFMLEPGRLIETLFFSENEVDLIQLPRNQLGYGKTVVVADDNQSIRYYISSLLEQYGFIVCQACNGKQVIYHLERKVVDLVIMDLEMPQLNGADTTSAIRHSGQHYASVPILGHTGYSCGDVCAEMRRAGMNGFISKPASAEQLLDKISSYISI